MAAFAFQQYASFPLDHSVFLPNTTIKNISGFVEEGNSNINCFAQFYPPEPESLRDQTSPLDARFHEASHHLDHQYCSKIATFSDNEPSAVTKKQSTDSSTVVDNYNLETGEQVTQKLTPMDKKRKKINGSSLTSSQSKDGKEGKSKRQRKCNGEIKEEKKKPKTEKKVAEEPPAGYIRVRARRGQATDSHSLAERVRREKISERMKLLQRLVPGCDKVTGKALMLDEIINYVQSLQNQVEFLSMKLASVNPLFYDFGMGLDAFMVRAGRSSSIPLPLPSLQQCNPIQATTFADANNTTTTTATATATPITTTTMAATTTTVATANNGSFIDSSTSVLLQGQNFTAFTQDSGGLLWDLEEQREKFLNPSGFNNNNNLCYFH